MMDNMIQKAFADMDPKTGMFPEDWPCLKCGVKLNTDGGHSAELYAGTFTGLCYACTASTGYVTHVLTLDGCRVWSYPPHSPSWRRDRESAYGYPECPDCSGSGRTKASAYGRPGESCKSCMNRFTSEPHRKNTDWLGRLTAEVAQDLFQRRLQEAALGGPAGVKRIKSKKRRQEETATWVEDYPKAVEEIRLEVYSRYRAARNRLDHLKDAWGVWETEEDND